MSRCCNHCIIIRNKKNLQCRYIYNIGRISHRMTAGREGRKGSQSIMETIQGVKTIMDKRIEDKRDEALMKMTSRLLLKNSAKKLFRRYNSSPASSKYHDILRAFCVEWAIEVPLYRDIVLALFKSNSTTYSATSRRCAEILHMSLSIGHWMEKIAVSRDVFGQK